MKETVEVRLDHEHGRLLDDRYTEHTKGFVHVSFEVLSGFLDGFCGQKRCYIIQRVSDGKFFAYEINAFTEGLYRYNDSDHKMVIATEVERKVEMIERVYYE